MKRFAPLLAAAASLALAAAVGAGLVRTASAITPATSTFPTKSFVLSLPSKAAINASKVKVTENGAPVSGLQVVPESAGSTAKFGVAVVVDASDSMQGAPIAAAMNATRAFVARRSSGQELSFVTFNSGANVVVPLTTLQQRDRRGGRSYAEARLRHAHVRQRVAVISQLAAAHLDSASIVLLSDGADTGSKTSLKKTLAAAQAAHVRIYTVGLHSSRFDPSSLKALAAGANGSYAEAEKPSELAGLFDTLGVKLAGQYLVRYQSFASPSEPVVVKVSVANQPGVATEQVRVAGAGQHPGPDHLPSLTVRAHRPLAVHGDRRRARLRAS